MKRLIFTSFICLLFTYSFTQTIIKNYSNGKPIKTPENKFLNPMDDECEFYGYPMNVPNVILAKTPNGGYTTGTNEYGVAALAQYFKDYNSAKTINGCRLYFGYATGEDFDVIQIAIWADNNGQPASVEPIYTFDTDIFTIKQAVAGKYYTDVEFTEPFSITGPFHIGFLIPQIPGDSIAVAAGPPGTGTGTNSSLLIGETWYNFLTAFGGSFNSDLVIFPYICGIESSIEDFNINNNFNIYPNPANDLLSVDINNNENNLQNISLYNSTGKLIATYYNSDIINNRLQINISDLNQGIYIINVYTDNGTYSKKFNISR
ncbi:MAG: T9SS type A sorting domain-containing protein [Bacteroidales bacterium]|nr:T9SS type A sorting domain-containing protein [Bacteroidales bacterium]